MLTRARGSCRRISAGRSNSSIAVQGLCPKSSSRRSPLTSFEKINFVRQPRGPQPKSAEEGTTRYSHEAGDTVHGRVDATRLQQEEELRDIIQKARDNPWHFFHHGLLRRKDSTGGEQNVCSLRGCIGEVDTFQFLADRHAEASGFRVQLGVLAQPPSGWLWCPFLSPGLRTAEDAGQHANMLVELNGKVKAYILRAINLLSTRQRRFHAPARAQLRPAP